MTDKKKSNIMKNVLIGSWFVLGAAGVSAAIAIPTHNLKYVQSFPEDVSKLRQTYKQFLDTKISIINSNPKDTDWALSFDTRVKGFYDDKGLTNDQKIAKLDALLKELNDGFIERSKKKSLDYIDKIGKLQLHENASNTLKSFQESIVNFYRNEIHKATSLQLINNAYFESSSMQQIIKNLDILEKNNKITSEKLNELISNWQKIKGNLDKVEVLRKDILNLAKGS
ncbi:hypothetical protein [Mycoplasma sp. 4423]